MGVGVLGTLGRVNHWGVNLNKKIPSLESGDVIKDGCVQNDRLVLDRILNMVGGGMSLSTARRKRF